MKPSHDSTRLALLVRKLKRGEVGQQLSPLDWLEHKILLDTTECLIALCQLDWLENKILHNVGGLSVCLVSGGRGGRVEPLDWLPNKILQNVGGLSAWCLSGVW